MFAQVNSVQAATDKLAGLVKWAEERLPAFRETPGFKGLYLLADRQSGKIVTISLWDSEDDLRQNNEARGAQVRKQASSDLGIAPTPVDIYEVVLQAWPATGPASPCPCHERCPRRPVRGAGRCRPGGCKDQPNERTD